MKDKIRFGFLFLILAVIGYASLVLLQTSKQFHMLSLQSVSPDTCTSFCLPNGNHCVFGTNFDNSLEMGMLFVNKRHVLKTTWDQSSIGEYARWVSRYGSVTVNFVGYQMVWAGMNEAGLMISTMSLNKSQGPGPDERFYFESPYWMQYQLDNHSTVDQVISSNAEIRVPESQVDHYLVCDRLGECAVIEFLEGRLVSYTGESLPVEALTNSTYEISLLAMDEIQQGGGEGYGNSIRRFVTVADRLLAFIPSDSEESVRYAFDTLKAVSRDDTIWSFVYDPVNMRIYFRTFQNPSIRSLDFSRLDFSCQTPVQMIDVHKNVSGDITDDLVEYDHNASFKHTARFFSNYEEASMSPILVEILLRGVESFPCQDEESISQVNLEGYYTIVPPTIVWAGLTVLHRMYPVWLLLIALSLAYLFFQMATDKQISMRNRILWVLVIVILGPYGLLTFMVARKMKHRRLKLVH